MDEIFNKMNVRILGLVYHALELELELEFTARTQILEQQQLDKFAAFKALKKKKPQDL